MQQKNESGIYVTRERKWNSVRKRMKGKEIKSQYGNLKKTLERQRRQTPSQIDQANKIPQKQDSIINRDHTGRHYPQSRDSRIARACIRFLALTQVFPNIAAHVALHLPTYLPTLRSSNSPTSFPLHLSPIPIPQIKSSNPNSPQNRSLYYPTLLFAIYDSQSQLRAKHNADNDVHRATYLDEEAAENERSSLLRDQYLFTLLMMLVGFVLGRKSEKGGKVI